MIGQKQNVKKYTSFYRFYLYIEYLAFGRLQWIHLLEKKKMSEDSVEKKSERNFKVRIRFYPFYAQTRLQT